MNNQTIVQDGGRLDRGQGGATRRSNLGQLFSLKEMGVFYALAFMVVVLTLITMYLGRPSYLSPTNISNVLNQAAVASIMAVSMTLVLITGNFDLSVASVAALSGAIFLGAMDSMGFAFSFAVGMGVAIFFGLVNGLIVQYLKINAFIVTLGTLTAVRGLVLIYTDGKTVNARAPESREAMKIFEGGLVPVSWPLFVIAVVMIVAGIAVYARSRRSATGTSPIAVGLTVFGALVALLVVSSGFEFMLAKSVIYMAVFTAIVWFVLTFTNIGRRLYSVGGNPEAARLSGINVVRYKLMAFVICSATAGFAGILFASRLRAIGPAALEGTELTVIAATILGGTSLYGGSGSVLKAVAGALILYTLANGFNVTNLGANYQSLIEGIVVVAAAAIYSVSGSGKK